MNLERTMLCVFLTITLLVSCQKELLIESPTNSAETFDSEEIRIATYNIHGGKGPNGEGNTQENLVVFRNMLQGEAILCFQEVEPDCWNQVKEIFVEFPYRFYLEQRSTKFGTNKRGGNAILSKFPIEWHDHSLIQCDPGGDKWQRKSQYIRIYIGNNHGYLNLFHFHNTYNWHGNNSESEKEGLEKFLQYVNSKELDPLELNVIMGDFNLSSIQCQSIISEDEFPNYEGFWVDHIYTNAVLLEGGIYNTVEAGLSDHNAVWGQLCNHDC